MPFLPPLPTPLLSVRCLALQGGSEKLGDEDLEAVLDKVVKMLAYISGATLSCLGWKISSILVGVVRVGGGAGQGGQDAGLHLRWVQCAIGKCRLYGSGESAAC